MHRFFLFLLLFTVLIGTVPAQDEPKKAVPVADEHDKTYILKPFDVINLSVFQEADLSTDSQLSVSGDATLPLLGTVQIGGMTVQDATAKITQLYEADYLISPKVSVTLKSIAAESVTIMGAVNQPKELAIPRDSPLDLVSALASVGNFLPNADKANIKVKRGESSTTYNFEDLTKPGASQVILQHGDRVDVPVSALANTIVTIIGEVAKPIVTSFPLDGKLSLQTLVGTVGGFTPLADKSAITIERDGKKFSVNLDANNNSVALKPGDIVTVPKSLMVDKTVTITGNVNRTGSVAFPLKGGLTLLTAISQAGGFSPIANKKKVTITRTVDGNPKTFVINATKIAEGEEKDFTLLPGDSISVPERLF
jgi:polysaccharide biosynthesis/export protein